MKLYRCLIGGLLAFFITIGVLFVVSYYEKEHSTEDGTLIFQYEQPERGDKSVASDRVCESLWQLYCV